MPEAFWVSTQLPVNNYNDTYTNYHFQWRRIVQNCVIFFQREVSGKKLIKQLWQLSSIDWCDSEFANETCCDDWWNFYDMSQSEASGSLHNYNNELITLRNPTRIWIMQNENKKKTWKKSFTIVAFNFSCIRERKENIYFFANNLNIKWL